MSTRSAAPAKRTTAKPRQVSDLALTVRIPEADGTLDKLTAFGLVDSTTLADQLRAAIRGYLDHRINNPDLPRQVADSEARHKARVAVLTSADATPPRQPNDEGRIAGRALGLRIDQLVYDKLTALAVLDDSPNVATQIRAAVGWYLDMRLADKTLRKRIEAAGNRHLDVLDTLITSTG